MVVLRSVAISVLLLVYCAEAYRLPHGRSQISVLQSKIYLSPPSITDERRGSIVSNQLKKQKSSFFIHNYDLSTSKLNAVVSWPRINLTQTNSISKISVLLKNFALIISNIFRRARTKLDNQMKTAAGAMEEGWYKRGFGGSMSRTIEVWGFAILFAFKYVSLMHWIKMQLLCNVFFNFFLVQSSKVEIWRSPDLFESSK